MNYEIEDTLIVGAKIKIGKEYSDANKSNMGFNECDVIELVEGTFVYDNGLYTEDQICPAIWDEYQKDFESIYHLFENDLSGFMDCEILNP